MRWFRKIWWWLIGRRRMKGEMYYIPITRIIQPPEGERRIAGIRVGIRRAIINSRPPKPARSRQKDVDKERLERIKAKRVQVA